jgi:2-polyprenyl-6-methoxyphenol hydroxylase-like FAD-dependent oxidoreductase
VRKPYGHGWALVGDAGYQKDPCTASGITDAFGSAEWLTDAIDDGFAGRQPLEQALAGYERSRITLLRNDLPTSNPWAAFAGSTETAGWLVQNQEQRSRFFGVVAHTVPVREFFSPENVQKIVAGDRQKAAVAL